MAFEWSVFPDDFAVATAVVVPHGSWLLLPIQRKVEYCLNIGGVRIAAHTRGLIRTFASRLNIL